MASEAHVDYRGLGRGSYVEALAPLRQYGPRKDAPCYRVWFCNASGDEIYVDVAAFWAPQAIADAHESFRALPGRDPMRGWWLDRWQLLCVPAGTDCPPWRLRIRLRARRWRRRYWLSAQPAARADGPR